jgi:hypothetical protein
MILSARRVLAPTIIIPILLNTTLLIHIVHCLDNYEFIDICQSRCLEPEIIVYMNL